MISLERVCRLGEIMCLQAERKLENSFLERREYVGKELVTPTTRLVLRVIWPAGIKPTAVWIGQTDQPDRIVQMWRLKRHAGRWTYEEEFNTPNPGQRIAIWWDWAPGRAAGSPP